MAGQTINDRLLAARHSIAGQGLAKSVCKATTEEMIGPKKKHLDYLIHCTNEPNVSIPQLANLLIERSQNTNWTVVFKALITVHHMLCYGNERFTQYLASSNSTFQLSNFLDKSGVPGYDMSPFIRRYAKYLNEKALSYRTVAFDFCKVKRGKEDGTLRTMNAEKLLKTLPVLQSQLDALLEFDCTANDLTNGVINMAFMLLFRDLIRLFACYNDGIINLLEKYFDMNKKQCREALDLYKKFLIRMDWVGEFLKVAENVGIDKGDIPDLTKAPSSLLDALEQHLASLEGKKGSAANTPTQTASNRTNVKSGVSALSSTSTAFGTAASNNRLDHTGNGHIDEALRRHALAEEEAAMNQYKVPSVFTGKGLIALSYPLLRMPATSCDVKPINAPLGNEASHWRRFGSFPSLALIGLTSQLVAGMRNRAIRPFRVNTGYPYVSTAKVQSPSSGPSTNPFLSSPTNNADQPIVDLFGAPTTGNDSQPQRASDDLLQLAGNPFADMFGAPQPAPAQAAQAQNNMWITNGNGFAAVPPANNNFVTDNSFSSVFGNQESQPAGAPGTAGSVPNPFMSDFPSLGPQQGAQPNAAAFGMFEQGAGGGTASDGQPQSQTGDLFSAGGQADLFGSDSAVLKTAEGAAGDAGGEMASSAALASGKSTATPPPRPPPPATATNGTPRPASPSVTGAAAGKPLAGAAAAAAPSKSAFDDLNDSIRMALGGSPSRPAPIAQQPPAAQQAQQPMQQGFGMFDMAAGMPAMNAGPMAGYGIPTQVPAGYGSPAKQPTSGFDSFGTMLLPTTVAGDNNISAAGQQPNAAATGKVLTGDLDSSLASLAQNLSINKSAQQQVKGMQWNSPKNAAKTGGTAGWTPQPMAATTGAGYRPMGQGMTQLPPTTLGFPPHSAPLGMQGVPMGMQGMQGMRPMMSTMPGGPGGMMVAGGAAPMMMPGTNPMMGANMQQQQQPQQQQQQQQQQPQAAAQPQNNAVQLDPFGAL